MIGIGNAGSGPIGPGCLPSRQEINAQLNLIQVDRGNEILAPVPVTFDGREQLVWAELSQVGGGSTAWINLVTALDSADTEVFDTGANPTTPPPASYWDWAWNTYQLAQSELGFEDQKLSMAYDLSELSICSYCGNRVVEYDQVECQHELPYHAGCLEQWRSEQTADDGPACHTLTAKP